MTDEDVFTADVERELWGDPCGYCGRPWADHTENQAATCDALLATWEAEVAAGRATP